MIRQPDFFTGTVEDTVRDLVARKKPELPWNRLEAMEQEEGDCLKMLHIRSYDDEQRTFAVMDGHCRANDLVRRGQAHKEIYLNDPGRTAPEKLKTVLRSWVRQAGAARSGGVVRGRHG